MPIRVLVGDDDPLIREALEITLSRDQDFTLVAVVPSGKAAVDACLSGTVDVALLDIRMPVMDGIEAAGLITRGSTTRVLLLSTFKEVALVRGALESRASGYLLKGCGAAEIKEAIRLVHRGYSIFRDDVFDTIRDAPAPGDLSSLNDREQALVKLIADGCSNREAADFLALSEGTVKNYISTILDKLGLRQRTQIAIYYLSGKKDFS